MSAILYRHHCVMSICMIYSLDSTYKSKVYLKIYARSSRFVMFGCGLVPIDLIHFPHGYFGDTESMI